MTQSQAVFIGTTPPEEYKPMIRELMAYDALCFRCNQLPRNEVGSFIQPCPPSPLHWSRQWEYPWAVVESDLDKSHRVLEVSGGHSVLKFALAKRCRQVIDTEFEQFYMPTIQETIDQQVPIWGVDNITQVWADVRSLPYPDNWFDRVFCISVLEHIPEGHLKGLQEMVRVLKPNGILMLSMDVVVSGQAGEQNNFYCNEQLVRGLLDYLHIDRTHKADSSGSICFSQVGNITITALLIKFHKNEHKKK